MTIGRRRALILGAILVIAAILAFPMRETIYSVVVIPVAFLRLAARPDLPVHAADRLVVAGRRGDFRSSGLQCHAPAKTRPQGNGQAEAASRTGGGSGGLAGTDEERGVFQMAGCQPARKTGLPDPGPSRERPPAYGLPAIGGGGLAALQRDYRNISRPACMAPSPISQLKISPGRAAEDAARL